MKRDENNNKLNELLETIKKNIDKKKIENLRNHDKIACVYAPPKFFEDEYKKKQEKDSTINGKADDKKE